MIDDTVHVDEEGLLVAQRVLGWVHDRARVCGARSTQHAAHTARASHSCTTDDDGGGGSTPRPRGVIIPAQNESCRCLRVRRMLLSSNSSA